MPTVKDGDDYRSRARPAAVLAAITAAKALAAATGGLMPTVFIGRGAQAAILRCLEGRLAAAQAASRAA